MNAAITRSALILFALAMGGLSTGAEAACQINSSGITISMLSASTGSHTPPTAPLPQAVTFTLTGTYDTDNSAGTCRFGLSWFRSSLPASMARAGGGATLPYTITSASGGGNTLLHTGGGTPALSNILVASFTSAGPNLNNQPFSVVLTAYFEQLPGLPQRAGSYSDALTLRAYNIRNNGRRDFLASGPFTVTGSVELACTIDGLTNPGADTATIPVSSGGLVITAPITRSYANVVCNSLSSVRASSLNGGVRRPGSAPAGFTNIINYQASASFGGATSNLNSATVPTASGLENGTSAMTSSATPLGTLNVTITPQATSQPLMGGSYADTLRITITPQ